MHMNGHGAKCTETTHSQISDLNVKLELGDGVKNLIFFETTNHFNS